MQTGLELYIPKQHRAEVKRVLKEKWNYECAYCGYQERGRELTVDHIKPISKGGDDSYENQVPCCRPCNLSKGDWSVRQWYLDSEHYTSERWLKIKEHMIRKTEDVLAA